MMTKRNQTIESGLEEKLLDIFM